MYVILNSKHSFTVIRWRHGDPYPVLGESVGIDTETTLIPDTKDTPLLAYLGVYNPKDNTAYIVDNNDAEEFINYIGLYDCVQYYFNVGFDFAVLSKRFSNDLVLYQAAGADRMIDVGIRSVLRCLATQGWIPPWTNNLKALTEHHIQYIMDKGEELGDHSDRLTFSPDKEITESQCKYLGIDCYCTWADGKMVKAQPTEAANTRGAIVLYYIERHGFKVDRTILQAFNDKLDAEKAVAHDNLISFGFPDPEANAINPMIECSARFMRAAADYVSKWFPEREPVTQLLKRAQARRLLIYSRYLDEASRADVLYTILTDEATGNKGFVKAEKAHYAALLEDYPGMSSYLEAPKEHVHVYTAAVFLEELNRSEDVDTALHAVDTAMEDKAEWFYTKPSIGPKKFLQNHLVQLLKDNPRLELPVTDKTKELKMTKDDFWRLDDLGINDPFLKVYVEYNHLRKFKSTYLDDKYIKSDGKVHSRMVSMVRTGRTAASSPNVQNLPSREKNYPLKNMYVADEGFYLCATDFSFIELCAFAQSCYTRFGYSVMREVINATVDPHRWFAGVMYKVIDANVQRLSDPQEVAKLKALLLEKISDDQRQKSKMANFGFPGGMSAKRFYAQCRSAGVNISEQDAVDMRQAWHNAFAEMHDHMKPEPCRSLPGKAATYTAYNIVDKTEFDDEDEDPGNYKYSARTITGMFRNRCSFNSALNIQSRG